MRVYFDSAATTQLAPEVIEAMTEAMQNEYGNPSSIHADGRKVRSVVEEARKTVADCIGSSIGEIFFTSGGTESNNTALKCAVRDLGVKRIITSTVEHHCVMHTVNRLEKEGVEIIRLDVDHLGYINYDELAQLLENGSQKTMVSLMHANNEIGTILDLERVSLLCKEHGALLHSDTVQTVGHFPIDVSKLDIHFLSCGAHKFHGPKGVGFLYMNSDAIVEPFIDGGSQERNMRAGTENVYGIVGQAKALKMAIEEMDERVTKIKSIKQYMMDKLTENFEDIKFNCPGLENGLYTVLNTNFPANSKNEMLLMHLDILGISASGGSACSSGADAGSHVIQAIGSDKAGRKSIRFSFSHYNTFEEVDFVVNKLRQILPEIIKETATVEV